MPISKLLAFTVEHRTGGMVDVDYRMSTTEDRSKVLFIGSGRGCEGFVRALEAAGYTCERLPTVEAGLARLQETSHFDVVVWDAEDQTRALDEAFDRGRYQSDVPTVLLLDRLYPWVAAYGRRPGALDYVIKPASPAELCAVVEQSVRMVKARQYVERARKQALELAETLSRVQDMLGPLGFGKALGAQTGELGLSEREGEIARLLAQGHRVSHIADRLGISPHTVRNHFKSVFRKLGVHSQVELLAKLRERRSEI